VPSGHLQGLDGPFGIVAKTIGRHLILHDLGRTFRSIAEATGVTKHQRKCNHSTKNDVDLSYVGLSDAAMAAAAEKVGEVLAKLGKYILVGAPHAIVHERRCA
jgi:hypothetical protein